MKTMIYCKPTAKGIHSFYLRQGGEEHFLFWQPYRASVQEHFKHGVSVNEVIKYDKWHRNGAIDNTIRKMVMYIKSVEKEYDIEILKQTQKKNNPLSYRRRRKVAQLCG